jgi:hypothetical protein
MSGAPRHQTFTITATDHLLIEYKTWHDDDDAHTHRILELSGEILMDALYCYLDGDNGDQILSLPPWRNRTK